MNDVNVLVLFYNLIWANRESEYFGFVLLFQMKCWRNFAAKCEHTWMVIMGGSKIDWTFQQFSTNLSKTKTNIFLCCLIFLIVWSVPKQRICILVIHSTILRISWGQIFILPFFCDLFLLKYNYINRQCA